MKKLSIIAIILSTLALGGVIFICATQKDNSDDIHRKALQTGYRIYSPVLPDTLTFAGEKVPMDTYYVREALDRELMVNMYWQSNMLLWLKRANRCFPVIEPILKQQGVPTDFKYLCVIESGLTNVTSPAKASGYWQFIKSTGEKYGLEINDDVDMRNDLEASTLAACKFLKSLKARFGSWTCAAAAYNCGEGGLSNRLSKEGVSSYYDVRLNKETSRYVFRILAAKLIMSSPQEYGFHVRKCDLYPQIPFRTVTLSGKNVDLYKFANDNNSSYKMLRELNPWIVNETIANKAGKTYTVKLPVEGGTSMKKITNGKKDTALVEKM